MVPHGATLRVLCLKCPSTWGTSQDIPGMVPHRATLCPMSEVSQDMGTSQDILGMVPHGATLCVLCLKCPRTWEHPGMVPHGATLCPMSEVSQDMGTSQDIPGMVPHGATLLCVLCLKCPRTWGSHEWSYSTCTRSEVYVPRHPRMVSHGVFYEVSQGCSYMGYYVS